MIVNVLGNTFNFHVQIPNVQKMGQKTTQGEKNQYDLLIDLFLINKVTSQGIKLCQDFKER